MCRPVLAPLPYHALPSPPTSVVPALITLLLLLLLNAGVNAFRLPCPISSSLLHPPLRRSSRLTPTPRTLPLQTSSLPSLFPVHTSTGSMSSSSMSRSSNDNNDSPAPPSPSPTPEEEKGRRRKVLTSSLSRLLTRVGGGEQQQQQHQQLSSLSSTTSSSRHRPLLRRLLIRLRGNTPSSFSSSSSSPSFLGRLQPGMSEHDREILRISLPALLTLLVDPFLSLCDTAYVSRVGTIALASLGPCTSIFHLSFNGFRAFSQSTTSLVSSSLALGDKKRVRAVILQALFLSTVLGSLVAFFLSSQASWVLSLMGAPPSSLLSSTGLPYLKARALAAPAVLMLMVCEGAYRGFGDTLTPLPVTFLVALVNLVLDPLLIFGGKAGGRGLGWGVAGAAWATVIAQYVGIAAYLCLLFGKGKTSPLYKKEGGKKGGKEGVVPVRGVGMGKRRSWREEEKEEEEEEGRRRKGQRKAMEQQQQDNMGESTTSITSSKGDAKKPLPSSSFLPSFLSTALPTLFQLLSANGAMLIRNGTLMLVWAYATATATRMSTLDVAAHQVALSIWLFFALVSEAPGIAAQVMAARLYSTRNLAALCSLARRLTSLGLTLGLGLGGALLVLRRSLPPLFASDPLVLGKVSELMVLLGLQLPLVALTLIGESFLVGCGKFGALAMCSTLTSGLCALVLRWLGQGGGGGGVLSIWWAIKGLFVMRLTCVAWLLYNPWKGTLSGRGGGREGGKEEEEVSPRLLMVE